MTRNRILTMIAACLLLATCGKTTPDNPITNMTKEGKAAIEALKKLKLKTEVGISYRDYSTALSDSLYPVTEYLKTKHGALDTAVNNAIRDAAKDYLMVSEVWNAKIGGTYNKDKPEYGKYGSLSVTVSMKYLDSYTNDENWLEPDRAIAMIWMHAGKEVAKLDATR